MISAKLIKELRDKTGAGMLDCKKALEESEGNIEKAIDYLREKGITQAAKKADRIAAEGLVFATEDKDGVVILEINSETDFVAKNEEFQEMVKIIGESILKSKSSNDILNLKISDKETVEDLIIAKTAKIGEKLSFRRTEYIKKEPQDIVGIYTHLGGKIVSIAILESGDENIAKDIAMHVAAMSPQYIGISDVPANVVEKEKAVLTEQAINEGKPANIAEKMVEGRIRKYFEEICLEEQAFVKDQDKTVKKYVEENKTSIKYIIRYAVGEGMEKREENFAEEVKKQMA